MNKAVRAPPTLTTVGNWKGLESGPCEQLAVCVCEGRYVWGRKCTEVGKIHYCLASQVMIRILFHSFWMRKWVLLLLKGRVGRSLSSDKRRMKFYPLHPHRARCSLLRIYLWQTEWWRNLWPWFVHLQAWKNGWLCYPKVLDTYQDNQGWKQVNFLFTSEKNDGKWPDEGILSTLAEVNGPREITHPTYHHLVIGPPLLGFSLSWRLSLFTLLGGRTTLEPCLSCEENAESLV